MCFLCSFGQARVSVYDRLRLCSFQCFYLCVSVSQWARERRGGGGGGEEEWQGEASTHVMTLCVL